MSKIKIPLLYALNYCLFSVRKNVTIIVYHGPSRFLDETLQWTRQPSDDRTVYHGTERSVFEEVPVARVRVSLPWHQEVRL